MRKFKNVITVFCIVSIVSIFAFWGISKLPKTNASNRNISMSLSQDASYTEDNLVRDSVLIVRATAKNIKEKVSKAITSKNSDGKEVTVKLPYVVYNFEVNDYIKKDGDAFKKIEVVVPDVVFDETQINFIEGTEYILYLYKAKDFSKNSYALTTYSSDIYEAVDNDNFKNIANYDVVKYDELKNKVKEKIKY